jgi:hypothetical protein
VSAGKGDARRPGKPGAYEAGWERVFNKDGEDGKDIGGCPDDGG